jgi:hypothetical protein
VQRIHPVELCIQFCYAITRGKSLSRTTSWPGDHTDGLTFIYADITTPASQAGEFFLAYLGAAWCATQDSSGLIALDTLVFRIDIGLMVRESNLRAVRINMFASPRLASPRVKLVFVVDVLYSGILIMTCGITANAMRIAFAVEFVCADVRTLSVVQCCSLKSALTGRRRTSSSTLAKLSNAKTRNPALGLCSVASA